MSKREDKYTSELKRLEPIVLFKYIQLKEARGEGQDYNIKSVNSTINYKIDEYAKIKESSYATVEALLNAYCAELVKHKEDFLYELLGDKDCLEYFEIFMRRYFLRKEKELSRIKPKQQLYELWFGNNDHCFGIMITPVYRFSHQNNMYIWENDKSEIRKVDFRYWSVAHILKTGIIDIKKNERIMFADIEELIDFYEHTFYDKSNSKYERPVMQKYLELLRQASDYNKIAFLIPELRFKKEKLHKYRLDFTVLSAEGEKDHVGFELSPDSSHAYTQDIEHKMPEEIKTEEIQRWEKEIGKRNDYYEKFGIHVRTFMEKQLLDIDVCFDVMKGYICFDDDTKGAWDSFRQGR